MVGGDEMRKRKTLELFPFVVLLGIGDDDYNGWSVTIALGLVVFRDFVFTAGWGWDDVLPLRPWPTWGRTYKAHDSGVDSMYDCVSLFGFYAGCARIF